MAQQRATHISRLRLVQPGRRRAVQVAVVGLCLLAAPMPMAFSQSQARGPGDGRAIDNSLQVGAGRVNPLGPDPDFAGRNAVVTGDVAGLAGFRGSLGYRAAGAFRGRLGSDDSYRFRAASSPGLLTPQQPGAVTSLTPPQTGATAGQVRDQRSPEYDHDAFSAGPRRLGADAPVGAQALTTPSLARPLAPDMPVAASLRPNPVRAPIGDEQPFPTGDQASAIERLIQRQRGDRRTPFERRDEPTREIGRLMDARIEPDRLTDPGASMERRLAQLHARLLQPLDSDVARSPGADPSDPYLRLLQAVRARTGAAAVDIPPRDHLTTPPTPEPDEPDQPGASRHADAQPDPQADADADAARRRARFLADPDGPATRDAGPADEPDDQSPRPLAAPADGAVPRSARAAAADRLVDALRFTGPRLATLASRADDQFNAALRDGERALAHAQYFDAEDAYQRALRLKPGHPLARVGLTHAQLGAGLIRSASLNLVSLVRDHPELIAVRYADSLLPPADRLDWIDRQLERFHDRQPDATGPMLRAYLAWQRDQPERVARTLRQARESQPDDPTLTVLEAIWLNPPAQPDSGSPEPVEPSPPLTPQP